MRRLLAFVAATWFAGLAMAAPFADMTPDMEYVSPEEMAVAIAAAATNQAASAAAVAVAATNHTDAVGAAVAQAATNHTDAVGAAVAVAATNHTDVIGVAVAVAATNHTDAIGAAVAQAATNHTDAVGAAVAVAATNHADAVGAAVAQAATNHTGAVGAAVAVAATNHADAVGAAVAQAATNHTDAVGAAVAQAATNHADAVGVVVAQAATNHTGAVGAAVAVAATNHADAVGAAVAQAATNHADAVGAAVAASVPGTVSNLVTKGFVEGLGIEAGTDGETVTNIVRDMAVTSVNGQTGAVSLSLKDVDEYGVLSGIPNYSSPLASNTKGEIVQYLAPYNSLLFGDNKGEIAAYEAPPGMLKGDKGDIESATAGVDYVAPADLAASELRSTNYTDAAVSAVARGVPGAISNTVTKTFVEALGISGGLPPGIDVESLERAIQVGEDLTLIDAGTNGWVIVVSNIVHVGDAHIPGTLFVGGRIYGVPTGSEGRIDIDGCDFFYNRQIPGDTTQTNGYGNLVTDPYMEWRLAQFFADYNAETTRMWNQVATINNLPDTLDDDLRTYNSVTSDLEAATMEVNLVRDEVNMTNAVMRAAFDRALAEAASSGEGWSATNATDECLILTDHGVTTCSASTSSYYIMLPSWTGTPAHCLAWFDNAAAWSDSPPSFYTSSAGAVYVDEALPAEFHAGGGKYLFDFRQLDEDTWFLSVHPAGVGSLGGNAR